MTRSATADSTETSSQPSAEAPTTKPATVKKSAEVIPRRSSGPENALQTMMITMMVAAATMRLLPPARVPASGGPRQSYTVAAERSAKRRPHAGRACCRVGCLTTTTMEDASVTTADTLPSWTDGAARAAIVEFVRSVTEPGTSFVAPPERVATFDNDGTLWCEKPLYPQADFVFRRWKEMMQRRAPELAEEQPYKALAEGDLAWLGDVYAHVPELIKGVDRSIRGDHRRRLRSGRPGVLRGRPPPHASACPTPRSPTGRCAS